MEKTIYSCDFCGKESKTKLKERLFPVIFHTEQTEGRSSKPYLDTELLELCDECTLKVVGLHATGAQGYNNFFITKIIDGTYVNEDLKRNLNTNRR